MATTAEGMLIKRRTLDVAFWVWIVVTLVPGAYLMASHLIAMPAPVSTVKNNVIAPALAELRPAGERGFLAVHVLLETCGCSRRVLKHLAARGPLAGTAEQILLIEGDAATSDKSLLDGVRARGFSIQTLSAQQLATRYAVESAPMMIVMSPENTVSYLGGYTDRKQSPAIRDSEIIAQLASGQTVKPLPLFGCAISKRLQTTFDPLGLKS